MEFESRRKVISFSISLELLELIDKARSLLGYKRSEFIRTALLQYLKAYFNNSDNEKVQENNKEE